MIFDRQTVTSMAKTQLIRRFWVKRYARSLACYACLVGIGALITSTIVHGEPVVNDELLSYSTVADFELDRLRGGFRTANGLEVSFGIRRYTLIDGNRQNDKLMVPSPLDYSADGSNIQYEAFGLADTIHNVSSSVAKDAWNQLQLIQNNLDNQLIQHISIMDIRISNLSTLRSSSSLSRWIAESVREF